MAKQDVFDFANELLASRRDIGVFDFASEVISAAQPEQVSRVTEEEAMLTQARSELERSPLPGVKAFAIEAGAGIVSPIARLIGKGEYADRMIRFSSAVEQVAREREKGGIIPDILQRGARGAAVSLATIVPAAAVGGPYAAIAVACGQETNRAITEGKDAGKKGRELAGYAVAQGVIEGIPATVMQKVGLGGLESLVSKRIVSTGLLQGLKRLGISAAQELPEEIVTELGHNIAAAISGVDPNALDKESLRQTVEDTTVQTLLAVGFAGAPSVAHSAEAGRVARITEEAVAHAGEDKVPSRKTWREWGLAPEVGESRGQRQAFTRELVGQLQEMEPKQPVSPEVPEAVIPEPVAAAEAPVAPEVPEVAMEPKAAREAPEVPVVPEDQTVALNKVAGAQIRESLDLPALGEEAVQTFDIVMNEVSNSKADEQALDVAQEVLGTPRQITSYEHVAMVLKATKLMNNLNDSRTVQAEAAGAGDRATYNRAAAQDKVITEQLDELTAAARYSRREVARALSIGRLRLSRESYDIVSVMQEMQIAKGPKARLSKKEQNLVARLTKEQAAVVEEVAGIEQEDRARDEEQERVIAKRVLTANKPRKEVGRSMRERAIAEREDIKKRIRQLGLRVNDITGVSTEGLYLIGRLGITYIKEGVGTLVGVVEQLRADLPDLNLSDQDVYRALISRSPKEKTRVRSEAAKRVARLTSMARMHVEINEMAEGIWKKVEKKRVPVPEDLKALQEKLAEARREYYKSDMDAARLERAIDRVNRLQDQLENGTKRIKEDPKEIPLELANVREQARELTAEIRINERLAEAKEQIRTGDIIEPVRREKKLISVRLERKQIELVRLRREIRQMIADAAPWTTVKAIEEISESARTLMATGEISFTLRQNVVQVFAHPRKALEAFGRPLKAALSQNTADEINLRLRTSDNAATYDLANLAILDSESSDQAARSEVFRAKVITRVPVLGSIIRASARHGVAFSNIMRAGGMDWFISAYPNATREELNAWADWQNNCSGLGSLWKLAQSARFLRFAIFAPKFSASRVQTPFKVFQYWKLPRVRKAIARDMVRAVSTGMGVLSMAALAGVNVVLDDPDDPDWGKIRIGNTRIDIWGGFQQPARVVGRIIKGGIARTGLIEEGYYGPVDPLALFGRFAAFKVSPAISIPREIWTGKTAVGEETGLTGTIARHSIMLFLQDAYDAAREDGSIAGGAVALVAGVGFGVSTYRDSQIATRRKIKRLRKAHEYGEAERIRLEWNQENPKNRIITVK